MKENLNYQKAERNAISLHFKDGFWEIFLGSFFVALAFEDILENNGHSILLSYTPAIIVFVVMMILYFMGKQLITNPRIGLVEIKLGNSPQRLRMFTVAVVIQLVILFVFLGGINGNLPAWIIAAPYWAMDAIFGILVFMFFTLMAYTIQANRFALYGFLLGAAMPLGVILEPNGRVINTYPSMIAGSVMVLSGVYVFYRFLKDYPIHQER